MQRLRRPTPAAALAALATVIALASALHSGPRIWRHLDRQLVLVTAMLVPVLLAPEREPEAVEL